MFPLDFNDINYKLINRVKLFQSSLTSLQNVHFVLTLNNNPQVTFRWPWRIHKSEISLMAEHRQNWSTVRTTTSTWLNVFPFREVQLRKLCHPLPPVKTSFSPSAPASTQRKNTTGSTHLCPLSRPLRAYNSWHVTFNCHPLHPSNANRKQTALNKC